MLRRALDSTYLAAAFLAAFCLAAIGVLVLLQVISRWFGLFVPAAEELAGYLMAATTFLALAWTLRSDGHIRVTLLIRYFKPRLRRVQEKIVLFACLLLVATLAVSSARLVLDSFQYGDKSDGYLAIPLWIPQLPMALGLAIFAVALADELFMNGRDAAGTAHD